MRGEVNLNGTKRTVHVKALSFRSFLRSPSARAAPLYDRGPSCIIRPNEIVRDDPPLKRIPPLYPLLFAWRLSHL